MGSHFWRLLMELSDSLSSQHLDCAASHPSLSQLPPQGQASPSVLITRDLFATLVCTALIWLASVPSMNFLLRSANSLHPLLLQSLLWPSLSRLKPGCHQRALFSCSTLMWGRFPLSHHPLVSGLGRKLPCPPSHFLSLWSSWKPETSPCQRWSVYVGSRNCSAGDTDLARNPKECPNYRRETQRF